MTTGAPGRHGKRPDTSQIICRHVTHLRRIQRSETLAGSHQSSEKFGEVEFEVRDWEATESGYHKN
ncbi:uncharacterized protein METZ01_LOCUS205702 [marine metagenome]|uniref:Uncharacterized protein n=1 Tax=marine metagenome TaxID=408172 RepID=A0A382EQ80_9ZZZZ